MIVLCDYKDFFNKETKQSLKNNGYYDNSEKQLKDFIKNTKKKRTQLDITISLTESCNLCCKYCSQSGVKNDSFITKEIIDEIIEYIEICKNKYGYKTFSIHLFGGEPLLQKQKILYLNSKLKEKNIPINYYMDTNGILLSEKFIKEFDNITFCVTLSNKCDHDNLRVTSNNTGSYDLIMENLNKIQYVLDNNHRLMVRYNVNDRNINDLEEFLKTIENIKMGNAVVRNNLIVSFSSRMMEYRGLGSGIRRALKYQPNIQLVDDKESNKFKVTIPRQTPYAGANDNRP